MLSLTCEMPFLVKICSIVQIVRSKCSEPNVGSKAHHIHLNVATVQTNVATVQTIWMMSFSMQAVSVHILYSQIHIHSAQNK